MNQTAIIKGAQLNDMQVEDLLNLSGSNVELLVDLPVLPAGFYHFVVKDCTIGQVGKKGEEKAAIVMELEITGVEALDNPADQKVLDEVDLPNNPLGYKENFGLQTKDGFGVRSFATMTAGWAASSGHDVIMARVENIAGAVGVCKLDVNTYLPSGKADLPENYRENNRLNVRQVVWA